MADLTDEQLMAIANGQQQTQVQQIPDLIFTGTTGRSATNNNPLNITPAPYFIQKYGAELEPTSKSGQRKFLKFNNMMDGYNAGLDQIRIDQGRGHTLASFVNKFAPPHENPTGQLIQQYGQAVGAGPDTPLAEIDPEKLIIPMLSRESSTRIVGMGQPGIQQVSYQQGGGGLSDEQLMDIANGGQQAVSQPHAPLTAIQPGGVVIDDTGQTDLSQVPAKEGVPPVNVTSIPQALAPYLPTLEGRVGNFLHGFKDYIPKGITENAPLMGMLAGGSTGARLGTMAGPLGALGGGVVGAGLGAMMGQQGKTLGNMAMGEPAPPVSTQLKQTGQEGLAGALGEMGGQIPGGLMSMYANRVASRAAADPAVAAAVDMVKNKGASISPSEISGSKVAKTFEWLADKVWPASAIMAKKRQSLQGVAEGLKEEFVASRSLYDTSKAGVGKAWDDWVQMAGGKDATYAMPETTQALQEAMGKPFAQMGVFWKKHAATFGEESAGGTVTVQSIRDLFNSLSPGASKGAERTAKMKIADAIMSDLGKSGNEEMVAALGNAREASYMNRLAGPLRAIFDKATISPTRAGDVPQFNPSTFVNLWNQRRGNFVDNKMYSSQDIRVIDSFADKMRALIPDLKKAAKYEAAPVGGILNKDLTNPAGVVMAAYNFPMLSVPIGLDSWLAHSLMSPNGLMRKILTTGAKPPTMPFKAGTFKVMEGKND